MPKMASRRSGEVRARGRDVTVGFAPESTDLELVRAVAAVEPVIDTWVPTEGKTTATRIRRFQRHRRNMFMRMRPMLASRDYKNRLDRDDITTWGSTATRHDRLREGVAGATARPRPYLRSSTRSRTSRRVSASAPSRGRNTPGA